jgi:hypothetical protein
MDRALEVGGFAVYTVADYTVWTVTGGYSALQYGWNFMFAPRKGNQQCQQKVDLFYADEFLD